MLESWQLNDSSSRAWERNPRDRSEVSRTDFRLPHVSPFGPFSVCVDTSDSFGRSPWRWALHREEVAPTSLGGCDLGRVFGPSVQRPVRRGVIWNAASSRPPPPRSPAAFFSLFDHVTVFCSFMDAGQSPPSQPITQHRRPPQGGATSIPLHYGMAHGFAGFEVP